MNLPENTGTALLVGYGSLGIVIGIAAIIAIDPKRRFEVLSNLIVALATVALTLITFFNLRESQQLRQSSQEMAKETKTLAEETTELSIETRRMADQTKRLADISIQQFKIASFPAFQLIEPKVRYEEGLLKEEFKICNKGDIAAYKVRILVVRVYETFKDNYLFICDFNPVYQKDNPVKTFDFDTKIFGNGGCKTLTTSAPLQKGYNIDQLKFNLLFVRFFVPYDSKNSFEIFSYLLERNKGESEAMKYIWEEISISDRNELVAGFKSAVIGDKSRVGKTVREFLGLKENIY